MGTNYLAPTWRQPENTNKDKLSNYSIDFGGTEAITCPLDLQGKVKISWNLWFNSNSSSSSY